MKTKYDINQVPEEVLKKIGQSILNQYQNKLGSGYGHFDICLEVLPLIEAAKVKQRTTAEVDAEIAETVRRYAEGYSSPRLLTLESLSYTSHVPGTQISFPKRIADLLQERKAIQENQAF